MSNFSLFAFALAKSVGMIGWPWLIVYGAKVLARARRVTCPPSAENLVKVVKSKPVLRRVA